MKILEIIVSILDFADFLLSPIGWKSALLSIIFWTACFAGASPLTMACSLAVAIVGIAYVEFDNLHLED